MAMLMGVPSLKYACSCTVQQPYDEAILQTTPAPDGGQAGGVSVGAGPYQGAALWPCLCSLRGKWRFLSRLSFITSRSAHSFLVAHPFLVYVYQTSHKHYLNCS